MSEFGKYLAGIKDKRGETAGKLAERIGIDQGQLSRYLKGEQRSYRQATLMKIFKRASQDPQEQAELLAAYLRDICAQVIPENKLVQVIVETKGTLSNEDPIDAQDSVLADLKSLSLDLKFLESIVLLARVSSVNKNFRRLLTNLAKLAQESITSG
jgi:transcriptional regulator with XRE-family HTH domain